MAKAVKELIASDGWRILRDVMRDDAMDLAISLSHPNLTQDENVHFQRGVIWAHTLLMQAPEKILMKLENEVALSVAQEEQHAQSRRQ